VEKRSENDGRFIPLCPLDGGLSDRDRLGHRSIGLVMSTPPEASASVLASFNPLWPLLNLTVARFELSGVVLIPKPLS
jgi:hypothetical protein